MAATKGKKRTYNITANGTYSAGIDVIADSLQDALEQAQGLGVTDFITFNDSHNDSSIKIVGVYEVE